MSDILDCFEEEILLDESRPSLLYSFSNELDEIQKAVKKRTGCGIQKNADDWRFNPFLSVNVQTKMTEYNIRYCMTVVNEDDEKYLCINKRDAGIYSIIMAKLINGQWQIINDDSDCDQIIDESTERINQNNNDVDAYLNRARAYILKGDNNSAIADFDIAKRFDPNNPVFKNDIDILEQG